MRQVKYVGSYIRICIHSHICTLVYASFHESRMQWIISMSLSWLTYAIKGEIGPPFTILNYISLSREYFSFLCVEYAWTGISSLKLPSLQRIQFCPQSGAHAHTVYGTKKYVISPYSNFIAIRRVHYPLSEVPKLRMLPHSNLMKKSISARTLISPRSDKP